jgi:hypothetical protein
MEPPVHRFRGVTVLFRSMVKIIHKEARFNKTFKLRFPNVDVMFL